MQFFEGSEISLSPPTLAVSSNNAHMMYVFNRNGVCLLYREWNRPLHTLNAQQDHKLMFGLHFSLKSLTAKMYPTSMLLCNVQRFCNDHNTDVVYHCDESNHVDCRWRTDLGRGWSTDLGPGLCRICHWYDVENCENLSSENSRQQPLEQDWTTHESLVAFLLA
ncbi:hypothetical protein LWI29_009241 [Acer saccharum]|uniref:Uncharacterized protein n=1 Tax=Acer saccharum TaxID=4024 RepID=A0AA39VWV8_ACESA|nr:hypothetical protein LWI29_009241 [Acer saccharum]